MLGMTPVLGKFFGLPLDVRHVTLNSGILSLATSSLAGGFGSAAACSPRWRWPGWGDVRAQPGVSFALSLMTAVRA